MASTAKKVAAKAAPKSTKKPKLTVAKLIKAKKLLAESKPIKTAKPTPKEKTAEAKLPPVIASIDLRKETTGEVTKREVNGHVIYSGIKLPPRVSSYSLTPKYPVADLEVGDTFFLDATIDTSKYTSEKEAMKASRESWQTQSNRIAGTLRRLRKRFPDRAFQTRVVTNGLTLGFTGNYGVVVERIK